MLVHLINHSAENLGGAQKILKLIYDDNEEHSEQQEQQHGDGASTTETKKGQKSLAEQQEASLRDRIAKTLDKGIVKGPLRRTAKHKRHMFGYENPAALWAAPAAPLAVRGS